MKLHYARPIYHPEMTIDNDLFLETLLLHIRGETIKFATTEKKSEEQQLIKDIKAIEESVSGFSTDLLFDKKVELENLRSIKMKGKIVCS